MNQFVKERLNDSFCFQGTTVDHNCLTIKFCSKMNFTWNALSEDTYSAESLSADF